MPFHSKPETLGDHIRNFYLCGLGLVAATMFIGNAYHGHRMAQRTLYNNKREYGIIVGIGKALSYSPFSWGFVCYALYRHLFRYQIRDADMKEGASYPSKALIGHLRMHIVPNVNDVILYECGYESDHKYLTQLGIIEPMNNNK